MITAKIIRLRHDTHVFINDHLKSIETDTQYKIVFSNPDEMGRFKSWIKDKGGKYDFDKENGFQVGEMPDMKEFFGDDICWCDIMSFYLLHVAMYDFHSALNPYKGEVYVKNEVMPEGREGTI